MEYMENHRLLCVCVCVCLLFYNSIKFQTVYKTRPESKQEARTPKRKKKKNIVNYACFGRYVHSAFRLNAMECAERKKKHDEFNLSNHEIWVFEFKRSKVDLRLNSTFTIDFSALFEIEFPFFFFASHLNVLTVTKLHATLRQQTKQSKHFHRQRVLILTVYRY